MKKFTCILLAAVMLSSVTFGQKYGPTTTLTVAAVDSFKQAIANSDFQCSGHSDDVIIQRAINRYATTGGKVELLAGTYTLSATVNLVAGVTVSGAGYATNIVAPPGAAAFTVNDKDNATIADLRITGVTTGTSAVDVDDSDNFAVRNVYFPDVDTAAVNADTVNGLLVTGCYAPAGVNLVTTASCNGVVEAVNMGRNSTYKMTRTSAAVVEGINSMREVAVGEAAIAPMTKALATSVVGGTGAVPNVVQAVDTSRGVVICKGGAFFFCTTDDPTLASFTNHFDIRDTAPFQAYRDAGTAAGVSVTIRSMVVLSDGSYLLALGYNDTFNADLWDDGDGFGAGCLYRSTDGGETWSLVLKMQYGYATDHSWSGINGANVAVGEYNLLQATNARNVYVSRDYGATWQLAYAPDAAADPYSHVHTVCWGLTDSEIYVSVGDGTNKELFKITEEDGVWTRGSKLLDVQPTAMLRDGNYLYLGNDGMGLSTIDRYNLVTGEHIPVLSLWRAFPETIITYNYMRSTPVVFSLKKIDGVFYAAVNDYLNAGIKCLNGGVYASVDGINWTCLWRVADHANNRGAWTIAGKLGGKIWAAGEIESGGLAPCSIVIDATIWSATGHIAGKGATNEYPAQSSTEFTTGHGYTATHTGITIARQASGGVHGGDCLKITMDDPTDVRGAWGPWLSDTASDYSVLGDNPKNGQYVMVSLWIKTDPDWPLDRGFNIRLSVKNGIAAEAEPADLVTKTSTFFRASAQWRKAVAIAKCTSDWSGTTKYLQFAILVDGTGGAQGKSFYIDAVSISYFDDGWPSFSAFPPSDAPRADCAMIYPLSDKSVAFTSEFAWMPKSGFLEWFGDIPIATWVASDGSHIDLFWQQSTGKIGITNGTDTALSAVAYPFEHMDCYMVSLSSDGDATVITITEPFNGETTITGEGIALTAPPDVLVCGTNYARSSYGVGIYNVPMAAETTM